MKIVDEIPELEGVITLSEAKRRVEEAINSKNRDYLYVVKYDGQLISFSGEYYKFAWKNIGYLRNALSQKFGKELAEALVENDVIQVIKVWI